jgi:hypothetical protein
MHVLRFHQRLFITISAVHPADARKSIRQTKTANLKEGSPMQLSTFEQAQIPTTYTPSEEQSVAVFIEAMCRRVNELLAAIPESVPLSAVS